MNQNRVFPHVVIRASAGTGKTYQLAARFIGLLAAGARPEEILATTFTRKAAGEILDRVLFWLAQAAADESERRKLVEAVGDPSLTRDKCRELLMATVRRLHAVRVGTLDSYFLQVAVSFGQELGLPPGWSICDEQVDGLLRDEAIELLLSRGKLADLLTLVHSLTKGAAARSVSRLVRDTVTSLFELYRETTPEAWQQIAVCKGCEAAELDETLEAIAALVISDKRMETARGEDVERFRSGNWEAFIEKGLASKVLSGEGVYYKKPLPPELTTLYDRLLKHVESILVGQVARQTEATRDLLVRFVEHYHGLQLEERALRFADVTFRLAEDGARMELERLAFRLDGGVRHLLLDEFQDTSPAQWRVLRPLAETVTKRAGGSFFCVGDAKQAIYGWRGGVAEIFDALDGQLKGLEARELATSHRSAQPVIDAVNAVFQKLAKHQNLDKLDEPVQRWQQAFPEHSTARTELPGHVTLTVAPQASDDEDQTLVLFQHAADKVRELLLAAPRASIGILVRTNTAVARLIYELRTRGVPASEEGGNPLIDSPAVELVLSLLKIGDHPGDSVARFHLTKSPLAQSLELSDYRDDAGAARLSQKVRRELLDDGYGPTIFKYAKLLAPHCDERDQSRLQQLVELAYEYQPSSTLRTSDFLRLVATRRIADPQAAEVRVMTIHQAKGLQFDAVFLPELEARLIGQPERFVAGRPGPTEPVNIVCRLADKTVRQFFPPRLQKLFEDDMCLEVSESLCVLYVAMTRAVHALYMIIAPAKPTERSLPKTFAGLLRATLGGGKPAIGGATLYEHGDAKWFARGKREGAAPIREGEAPAEPPRPNEPTARREPRPPEPRPPEPRPPEPRPPLTLAPVLPKRERSWERMSPSSLEGGVHVAGAAILAARSPQALGIGTLFHAWLAETEWLDDGPPSEEVLRRVAARMRADTGASADQVAAHLVRFRQQLAAPPIAEVLSRRFYDLPANLGLKLKAWPAGRIELAALRERSFAIRQENSLLAGSIDRLVIIRSGGKPIAADVIDFKTDEIAPGDKKSLAARVEFYRPQMEAYRAAVGRLLGLASERVAMRLVFLSSGSVQALQVLATPTPCRL
jgi:ATP-dependent helicase/nuclease subunit A